LASSASSRERSSCSRQHLVDHRPWRVEVAFGDPGLALLPEHVGRVPCDADRLQLRYLRLLPGEVGIRVEDAPVGELLGVGEELVGDVAGQVGAVDDLAGDDPHLPARFQPGLRIRLRRKPTQRQKQAGGVEDVAGDRVIRVQVTDVVGQDRRTSSSWASSSIRAACGSDAGRPGRVST
jgi:hypothetical protein